MPALHGANCAEPTRSWLTLHSREQARRFAITQENLLRIPASQQKYCDFAMLFTCVVFVVWLLTKNANIELGIV